MQAWLTARAYADLVYVDFIRRRGFRTLRQVMTGTPIQTKGTDAGSVTAAVVKAVQTACLLYVRQVNCLQRSMVVTRMLRRRGVAADVVIGCRVLPLLSHAWVEVDGVIVHDALDDLEQYRVLDRW